MTSATGNATGGTPDAAPSQHNSLMDPSNALIRFPAGATRLPRGFTLVEVMIVAAVIGILAAIAVPAYLDHVRKARRADAIARISQIQQAQERWRANNATYGTLANLGIAATTADGFYTLSVPSNAAATYQVLATATGAQVSDTNCRFMQISMSVGNTTLASGPTVAVGNATAANNRCWNR